MRGSSLSVGDACLNEHSPGWPRPSLSGVSNNDSCYLQRWLQVSSTRGVEEEGLWIWEVSSW